MSIPFGKHYGATFLEAIIILESLQQAKFDEPEKEKRRLSTINYIESKLWEGYPYQCEDYYKDKKIVDSVRGGRIKKDE